MDDIRIYNRVLTASEIAALAAGHPMGGSGTVTLQDTLDVDGDMTLGDGTTETARNCFGWSTSWAMVASICAGVAST